jgi:hypothetical protein
VTVAPAVDDVLRSPGQMLDERTRFDMSARLGHDFSRVRVHTDQAAASSARALGARAYTIGRDIVFGAGEYHPHTTTGDRLLAHELAHVAQQGDTVSPCAATPVISTCDGGYTLAVAPLVESSELYERNAHELANAAVGFGSPRAIGRDAGGPSPAFHAGPTVRLPGPALQRFELPTPVPICNAMVTDIDVLPARPRPLVECGLPPTLMVTRINVVGRARGPTSTGRGRIVFNLHIGYYRDPTTGRLCAVISDSMRCLTPGGCIYLGCFPTLREVLDAIWQAIKDLLEAIGIILLAILLFLILKGLRTAPSGGGLPAPVLAEGGGAEAPGPEAAVAEGGGAEAPGPEAPAA